MRGWLDESAFSACRTWTTIVGGSRHLCLAPAKQPVPTFPIQETGCGAAMRCSRNSTLDAHGCCVSFC